MDEAQAKFHARAIAEDPAFSRLPDARQKSLQAVWIQFVTARTTLDNPDWGTLFNMVMTALPQDDAEVFARAAEKFS